MKTTYRYNIPDQMNSDDYYEFKSYYDDSDGDWLAEAAADDYHHHHDGWESHWPITFILQREDGSVVGTYEVERETVPQFNATEVKK